MTTAPELRPAGTPVPLRRLVVPTAAAGGVFAAAAALSRGAGAAGSATAGVVVVLAFFGVTHVVLTRVLARAPELAMGAAMLLYVTKILAMFGLIYLVKHWGAIESKPFGFSVLACTLAWTVAEVISNLRQRTMYVDPSAKP